MKQKSTELKGKIDKATIKLAKFNPFCIGYFQDRVSQTLPKLTSNCDPPDYRHEPGTWLNPLFVTENFSKVTGL
jgi:hypothetical protein